MVNETIEECLESLGMSFRGLWTTQYLNDDGTHSNRVFWVTYQIGANLFETKGKETALEALQEAITKIN